MSFQNRLSNMNTRDFYKEELKKLPISNFTSEKLDEIGDSSYSKFEITWAANELAKEGEIDKALQVAEAYFIYSENDEHSEGLHKDIEEGKDTRVISTVKGAVCWLLQSLIVELIRQNAESQYYTRTLNIVEELANDKSLYVRQQATVPLEILAANIKATQHSESKQEFKFSDKDKERAESLAFQMLDTNYKWDRVLEYLTSVFNRMRYLKEDKAMHVLESFFYKDGEIRPDYVTDSMTGLAIYYAEFRVKVNDGFDNSRFQTFFRKLLDSNNVDLKSNALWIIWKNYNKDEFSKVQPYLPLFLTGHYNDNIRVQWDFLVEKVIEDDIEEGVSLLKKSLDYAKRALSEHQNIRRTWLYLDKIIEKIATQSPDKFREIIPDLKVLKNNDIYIGDLTFLKNTSIKLEELE